MLRPPTDPRYRPAPSEPTWQNVLVGYAMIAAVPALLWVASQPSTRLVAVAAVVGLALVARHLLRLVRCFDDCRGFAFDLGQRIRITITQPAACEAGDQQCTV